VTDHAHASEWVSYCSHVEEDGSQFCDCAPDLVEVVEERDALREEVKRLRTGWNNAEDVIRELGRLSSR